MLSLVAMDYEYISHAPLPSIKMQQNKMSIGSNSCCSLHASKNHHYTKNLHFTKNSSTAACRSQWLWPLHEPESCYQGLEVNTLYTQFQCSLKCAPHTGTLTPKMAQPRLLQWCQLVGSIQRTTVRFGWSRVLLFHIPRKDKKVSIRLYNISVQFEGMILIFPKKTHFKSCSFLFGKQFCL